MRFSFLAGIVLAGVTVGAATQTQPRSVSPAVERFDVVSVKRNMSNDVASSLRPEPNGVTGVNVTVLRLIRVAYQVADFQVADAPGWFTSEHYDVTARTTAPVSIAQVGSMLRTLLADRFALRITQQQRDSPVLELRVDGDRARMKPSSQPCGLAQAKDGPIAPSSSPTAPPCFSSIAGSMIARGVTSGMVAQELTRRLERFVIDKTGLAGAVDFDLEWTPDGAAAADANLPPLVTAVREQLGLRLVPARAPVDVYVVEAALRPQPD